MNKSYTKTRAKKPALFRLNETHSMWVTDYHKFLESVKKLKRPIQPEWVSFEDKSSNPRLNQLLLKYSLKLRHVKKPLPVSNHYEHWIEKPYVPSARCIYWKVMIKHGWRPNKRISELGYDCSAEWYGIYIWEYVNVIAPLINSLEK